MRFWSKWFQTSHNFQFIKQETARISQDVMAQWSVAGCLLTFFYLFVLAKIYLLSGERKCTYPIPNKHESPWGPPRKTHRVSH